MDIIIITTFFTGFIVTFIMLYTFREFIEEDTGYKFGASEFFILAAFWLFVVPLLLFFTIKDKNKEINYNDW